MAGELLSPICFLAVGPRSLVWLYNSSMQVLSSVVIVGKPNVGKSTLFNRITGRRRAIVGNEPGMTRDRIYGWVEWLGKEFEVVDTGGMLVGDSAEIPARIIVQAQVAIDRAQQVVMVVDGRSAITASDQELARLLRRTGKPLLLAVNKMDTPKHLPPAAEFYALGVPRLFPISAENGMGLDDLLDEITAALPTTTSEAAEKRDEINVAIIGKPNVGKSTLLNRLSRSDRSIVSETPGTTRDAVDTLVEQGGTSYRLVDTAGIRRKGKTKLLAEKLSVVMARRHLRMCNVALFLLDGTEDIAALDATIAGYAHQDGKSIIILVNKWDQVQERGVAQKKLLQEAGQKFKFLEYVPRLFISAKTGLGVGKIFPEVRRVDEARRLRITTAELNRFLRKIDLDRATSPYRLRPKIYYMTQSTVSPPTFVLFTDKKRRLHFSFERFLINQLRKQYGFQGTPILIKQRYHRA